MHQLFMWVHVSFDRQRGSNLILTKFAICVLMMRTCLNLGLNLGLNLVELKVPCLPNLSRPHVPIFLDR